MIDGRKGLICDVVNLADGVRCCVPNPLDMGSGEQQVIWVDVSRVDESLGLFGTPARIARIHQTALVIHKLVQIATGPGQTLAEVVGRHFHHLAADGVAHAENLSKGEDQSLPSIQAKQHPHGAGRLGLLDQ